MKERTPLKTKNKPAEVIRVTDHRGNPARIVLTETLVDKSGSKLTLGQPVVEFSKALSNQGDDKSKSEVQTLGTLEGEGLRTRVNINDLNMSGRNCDDDDTGYSDDCFTHDGSCGGTCNSGNPCKDC